MKKSFILITVLIIASMGLFGFLFKARQERYKLAGNTGDVYQFTMKSIDGKEVPLSQYTGMVLVIVITDS
jgi:hypothetical protein